MVKRGKLALHTAKLENCVALEVENITNQNEDQLTVQIKMRTS